MQKPLPLLRFPNKVDQCGRAKTDAFPSIIVQKRSNMNGKHGCIESGLKQKQYAPTQRFTYD